MGLPVILPISHDGWSTPPKGDAPSRPVHVRIVSTYPADPFYGLPEEIFDFTIRVPSSFARTPQEASERINKAFAGPEEALVIPDLDDPTPYEFWPEVVKSVAVW